MKIKTSELIGMPLDWAVAYTECLVPEPDSVLSKSLLVVAVKGGAIRRSTDWAQGGPIIEREAMCVSRTNKTREEPWAAYIDGYYWIDGPTPLIAAMRCYVASKLGDEVDVPDEIKI